MAENAMTERYEEIELFGKPGLFSNFRIDRSTVPQGWYCYDLRGSDFDPGRPIAVEPFVVVNHAATVLTPEPVAFKKDPNRRMLRSGLNFLGYELTLSEFCKEHGLPQPFATTKCDLRPASPEEAGLFYAQTPEQDEALGAIGHVRIDFGHGGREFWHTWHPRGPEEMNSPEFKAELNKVVGQLREGVLHDLSSMRSYCHHHGGEIEGGVCTRNYGYTVETERYRYLLRCNPIEGDYQAYLSCFDKQAQEMRQKSSIIGRVSFASGEQIEYIDPAEYLKTIREELPCHATSGFRFETLTSDPEVRKAADDMLYDLYGEDNPCKLEDYQEQHDTGMTMGGM